MIMVEDGSDSASLPSLCRAVWALDIHRIGEDGQREGKKAYKKADKTNTKSETGFLFQFIHFRVVTTSSSDPKWLIETLHEQKAQNHLQKTC
jgi:hypothetical protein